MNTSILIPIYARYKSTKLILDVLQQIKPYKLFISTDFYENNLSKVVEQQKILNLFKNLNWECSVQYNISDKHLGPYNRLYTALDWVFSFNTDRCIVIEDDVVPSLQFFNYCKEIPESDIAIGSNLAFQAEHNILPNKYYNSKFCLQPWGLALPRNIWISFKQFLSNTPLIINTSKLHSYFGDHKIKFLYPILNNAINQFNNTNYKEMYLDALFQLYMIQSNTTCIVPSSNLITYYGFDKNDYSLTTSQLTNLNIIGANIPGSFTKCKEDEEYRLDQQRLLKYKFMHESKLNLLSDSHSIIDQNKSSINYSH